MEAKIKLKWMMNLQSDKKITYACYTIKILTINLYTYVNEVKITVDIKN